MASSESDGVIDISLMIGPGFRATDGREFERPVHRGCGTSHCNGDLRAANDARRIEFAGFSRGKTRGAPEEHAQVSGRVVTVLRRTMIPPQRSDIYPPFTLCISRPSTSNRLGSR